MVFCSHGSSGLAALTKAKVKTVSEAPPPVEVGELIKQLASDAKDFARSEAVYLRAQLGERTAFAKPALLSLGFGGGVILGSAIVLPIGVMMALTPWLGAMGAAIAVFLTSLLAGGLLIIWGIHRLKAALKRPENR